jgi:hypothetical protein
MVTTSRWQQLRSELRFTRSSKHLLSLFFLTLFVLGYVWWPLALEYLNQINWQKNLWPQIDWLLIGIFVFMSFMLMAGADLRRDATIIFVGFVGGLVIESWGTQTEIWTYYTAERPPLWIIPAWPIASLTIDRMVYVLDLLLGKGMTEAVSREPLAASSYQLPVSSYQSPVSSLQSLSLLVSSSRTTFTWLYWLIFPAFYVLMLWFVWPTLDKSFTLIALTLCAMLILTPTNHRIAVLTFTAGVGLGYFLERWGTTRLCWTYYTQETPPLFAVLAHGMAAVAFWRSALLLKMVIYKLTGYSLAVTGSPQPLTNN